MATPVWKGHLSFGLVSIPVKLYRAARPDKVEFRQVHEATGSRVRQALYCEPQQPATATQRGAQGAIPFRSPAQPVEVSRGELAKGYEYERGRYLVLSREEIESITPPTAYQMQILEFVKLAEVDPIYFETSYYVAPDRAGERAYALLLRALGASGLVGIAQVAMHRREHVVVLRPGRTGIILHTMFYEPEIRREDECRPDLSQVLEKELELALLLVNSLAAPFEAAKYRDSYREKLNALIAAKLEGKAPVEPEVPSTASVVNILDALKRSLEPTGRKPTVGERSIPHKRKSREK